MSIPILVRDGANSDLNAVQRIYTFYVTHSLATFEETPPTVDDLSARRQIVLNAGLPYLVATLDDQVVGYAYATIYRLRPAYRHTIEDSIYVAQGFHAKGIGRALLTQLIQHCEAGPWRQMIAVIGDSQNAGSIALHKRLGFHHVGTFKAVGFKLGQWVDTVLMQRALGQGGRFPPESANSQTG
jgi:phosphinothricin acetyltransferase